MSQQPVVAGDHEDRPYENPCCSSVCPNLRRGVVPCYLLGVTCASPVQRRDDNIMPIYPICGCLSFPTALSPSVPQHPPLEQRGRAKRVRPPRGVGLVPDVGEGRRVGVAKAAEGDHRRLSVVRRAETATGRRARPIIARRSRSRKRHARGGGRRVPPSTG